MNIASRAEVVKKRPGLCARASDPREGFGRDHAVEISSRNAPIQALQTRWKKMRKVIEERGASEEYASVPGGSTGLLTKDYKGKQADIPVYKVDTALLAELRAHERRAAEELCQWKAVIEERKMRDATPAAITLAMMCTGVRKNEATPALPDSSVRNGIARV